MISKLKIAAIQLCSSPDRQDNLERTSIFIEKAVAAGAQMISLPEVFSCFTRDDTKWEKSESHDDSETLAFLREQACRHKIFLHGGSFHVRTDTEGKVWNRSYTLNQKGEILGFYDKIHLFDVNLNNGQNYCESLLSQHGCRPSQVVVNGIPMGMSICYDVRFPELYRLLSRMGSKVLFVPAAFIYKTGEPHWELLLRARAIENQCYVVAANQWGQHKNGFTTWGHSMIVDPWGEILAEIPEGEGFIIAEIDFDKQAKLRQNMPVLLHRRMS